ncbi:unnamed protein product [Oncorhynchus mykiss]|uniref:Uncharacterized protein n=1 Tax=Oncorhynchus mykiss TaxID=8022 RepID=A0A060VR82_ONCMY|nr:unnamed protein product [Oncorhynchus mykiss]
MAWSAWRHMAIEERPRAPYVLWQRSEAALFYTKFCLKKSKVVAVTTKTAEDDVGTQYTLDLTGRVVSQKPSPRARYHSLCTEAFFKNLPVRKQYCANMNKYKEEQKKVQDLLMAYATVKPEPRLTLTHSKVVVWQKAKVSDHRIALMATLGPNTVAHLLFSPPSTRTTRDCDRSILSQTWYGWLFIELQ